MLSRIHKFIEKHEPPNWVVYMLFALLVIKLPSLIEPFYYTDEMIYVAIGKGLRKGLTLYSSLYDHKPPLIYLVSMITGSVFGLRVALLLWQLLYTVFFYRIVVILFKNNISIQKIALFAFVMLTSLPVFEGQIANAEGFMIGFTLIALYLVIKKSNPSPKILLVSGTLFAFGALFKIPSGIEFILPGAYLIIVKGEKISQILKIYKYLVIGFLIPVCVTVVFFFASDNLNHFVYSVILDNSKYITAFRPDDASKNILLKNLPLIIRSILLILTTFLVFRLNKLKKFSGTFAFVCVWLFITLFAATLSERPYTHYLIQSLPALSIIVAILFKQKTKTQLLAIFPLTLFLFVTVYFKFYTQHTTAYFSRFFNYATGKITREQYLSSFSDYTARNYELSDYLLSVALPNDRVFVWGDDSAAVYAITGLTPATRYLTDFHVESLSTKDEVGDLLFSNPPEFVVIIDSKPFSKLHSLIDKNYLLLKGTDNYEVWRLKK